jgi:hypothetical protein
VVKCKEARQNFLLWKVGGPAVSCEDCFVEDAVGVGEPFGPLIVEVRQGSLLQFILGGIRWIQPSVAQPHEITSGVGDNLDASVLIFGWFDSGRPRKREGLEA